MREPYKGYVIDARTYQLQESDEWVVNATIEKHHGDKVNSRPFSACSPTFMTRNEALMASIEFGRQIIDGKFNSLSVDGL